MANYQVLGPAAYWTTWQNGVVDKCIYYVYSYHHLVFIFCHVVGAVYGGLENPKLTYSGNVKLRAGINKISMLSVAVGLPVSSLHPVSLFSRISNCNSTSYVV